MIFKGKWHLDEVRKDVKWVERGQKCILFVGYVDTFGIMYDVLWQYVSQITIRPVLSAIKNTLSQHLVLSRFIRDSLVVVVVAVHIPLFAIGNKWPYCINHLVEN